MQYVVRDAQGSIVSLHREPVPGAELLPLNHPDIQGFLSGSEDKTFASMDADLVRVLEDLIDVLLKRNVFCITDLPPEAQAKLFERKHFREGLQAHALNLYAGQHVQADSSAMSMDPNAADLVSLDWQGGKRAD